MTFNDFWARLFGDRTIAFIKASNGRTLPLGPSDRRIAEFFWHAGQLELMSKEGRTNDEAINASTGD